jgi:hypothetical protein
MAYDATGDITGTTPLAGSGEATLLRALQQMQSLQNQPMLPDNPLVQLGSILAGFGAGVRGQSNPVVEMYRQQRKDQLGGLAQQATIGGALGTIESQRASRAASERAQANTEAHQRETERLARENVDLSRTRLAYDMNKASMDSDSYEERLAAYRRGQKITDPLTGLSMVPIDADVEALAYNKVKHLDSKKAQLVRLLQEGEDPLDTSAFGNQFPARFFPELPAMRRAMAEGGPTALERFIPKSERDQPTTGVLQARLAHLASLAERTEEQERQYVALKDVVGDKRESDTWRMTKMIQGEERKQGLPPRLPSVIMEEAKRRLDRSESVEKDLDEMARKRNLDVDETFAFKDKIRKARIEEIAKLQAGAVPLPVEIVNKLAQVQWAKNLADTIATDFTPAERAKYVGYARLPANKLKQLIGDQTRAGADPKFARFYTLLMSNEAATLFAEAGKQLVTHEERIMIGFVMTGKELSVAQFEAKLKHAQDKAQYIFNNILELATSPKSVAAKMGLPPSPPTTSRGSEFGYKILPGSKKQVEIRP